jgi:hypothetical protein
LKMPNAAAEVRGSKNIRIKGGSDDANDRDADIKRGFALRAVQSGNDGIHLDPRS